MNIFQPFSHWYLSSFTYSCTGDSWYSSSSLSYIDFHLPPPTHAQVSYKTCLPAFHSLILIFLNLNLHRLVKLWYSCFSAFHPFILILFPPTHAKVNYDISLAFFHPLLFIFLHLLMHRLARKHNQNIQNYLEFYTSQSLPSLVILLNRSSCLFKWWSLYFRLLMTILKYC